MAWTEQNELFNFKAAPQISGEYRLHRADGTHTQVVFADGKWLIDTTDFVGWTGRLWRLTEEEVLALRRRCGRFKAHKTDSYRKVAQAAVRLARHYASARQRVQASRYYLIAHRIDVTSLKPYDLEWQTVNVRRVRAKRPDIDAQVDGFFSKRGEPVKQSATL